MSVRPFHIGRMQYGTDFVASIRMQCSNCPNHLSKPRGSTKTLAGPKEEEQRFTKMFERDGWFVGRRPQEDLCPGCYQAQERMKRKPKLTVVGDAPQEKTTVSTPQTEPRKPTMSERRGIYGIIEENYSTDNTGYKSGWTDQKIATELGLPLAWVVDIRKEFFGSEGGNPEITKSIGEARAYLTEAQALVTRLEAAQREVAAVVQEAAKLATRGQMIERRISEIEKAVKS